MSGSEFKSGHKETEQASKGLLRFCSKGSGTSLESRNFSHTESNHLDTSSQIDLYPGTRRPRSRTPGFLLPNRSCFANSLRLELITRHQTNATRRRPTTPREPVRRRDSGTASRRASTNRPRSPCSRQPESGARPGASVPRSRSSCRTRRTCTGCRSRSC